YRLVCLYFFFFFQAEDGIRDRTVTGVQTCALPICTQATQTAKLALSRESTLTALAPEPATVAVLPMTIAGDSTFQPLSRGLAERSEERRVGKECRSGWSPDQ